MHAPDDQHAAVIHEPVVGGRQAALGSSSAPAGAVGVTGMDVHVPFVRIVNAHAKLPRARLHAAADHETVARLEHVKRTRHGGVGHGAHKDGHVLGQAGEKHTLGWDWEPGAAGQLPGPQELTQRAPWSRRRGSESSLHTPDLNTAGSACPRGSSPCTSCVLDTGDREQICPTDSAPKQ